MYIMKKANIKQLKASERNFGIMQFRGCYNRIRGMIPDDIWEKVSDYDKEIIELSMESLENVKKIMDNATDCRHLWYDENNICTDCGHKKYSRDKLGKKEGREI